MIFDWVRGGQYRTGSGLPEVDGSGRSLQDQGPARLESDTHRRNASHQLILGKMFHKVQRQDHSVALGRRLEKFGYVRNTCI